MKSFFLSAVGRKFTIGLTGIILAGFAGAHMMGNLLLFAGPKSYNIYSHTLINHPLTLIIEIVLLASFVIHSLWAVTLTLFNRQKKGPADHSATQLIHKTLWIQGVIIFVFVILHLITFKYGSVYWVEYDGQRIRDLFQLVAEVFQKPVYTAWYLLCLLILSFHLAHGLKASIRSIGFYSPLVDKISLIYSAVVTLGFVSQPLYFLFFYSSGVSLVP